MDCQSLTGLPRPPQILKDLHSLTCKVCTSLVFVGSNDFFKFLSILFESVNPKFEICRIRP